MMITNIFLTKLKNTSPKQIPTFGGGHEAFIRKSESHSKRNILHGEIIFLKKN
jgi:hypothetical protein